MKTMRWLWLLPLLSLGCESAGSREQDRRLDAMRACIKQIRSEEFDRNVRYGDPTAIHLTCIRYAKLVTR